MLALATNTTTAPEATEPAICEPGGSGLFFPLTESEQYLDKNLRAAIYALVLIYLFCGISVVADRFMGAIDRITSRKKIVRLPQTGRLVTIETWNGTIANLSLLALGSSAPEILLSIVEIFMNKFHAGALGPGTMIGSAAFNLCCIVAVGISAIPSPDTRHIKHEHVFFVTVFFAFFGYSWLTFIVQVNTPDVVTVSEGIITVSFYPVLLVVAYLAHIGWFKSQTAAKGKPAPREKLRIQQLPSEVGDPACIRDMMGKPIENVNGVLTFEDDLLEIDVGLDQRHIAVPVLRKNGNSGTVSCKYRMEARNAVAGKDFEMDEGELLFPDGVSFGEIPVTLLPKALTETKDQFQIIIENATGGAVFNPNSDGNDERCILTVEMYNQNDGVDNDSAFMRMARQADRLLNLDAISVATTSWSSAIGEAMSMSSNEDGSPPSGLDTILHFIFLPWRLGFAIVVPPPGYCGGWLTFGMCMVLIGLLSSIVCDFSELFGCCAGIENYITAITFVAMGTSMPDLFVSKTAAVQDEYADSSITTVTGGDSARVFLGIGIPWTIAAIYWNAVGPTEEWLAAYGSQYGSANPQGAFIVPGGMLGFNVILYLMAAVPCILMLRARRAAFGAELGGPFVPKVLTSIMFVLLWFFYLIMSIWKITAGSDDLGDILTMMWNSITALEHVGVVIGIGVFCMMRKPAQPDDDQHQDDIEAAHAKDDGLRSSALANGPFCDNFERGPTFGDDPYYGFFERSPTANLSLVSNLLVATAAVRFKRGLGLSARQGPRLLGGWHQPALAGRAGVDPSHFNQGREPSPPPCEFATPRGEVLRREESFHSIDIEPEKHRQQSAARATQRPMPAFGLAPPDQHGFAPQLRGSQQQPMWPQHQGHQPVANFPRQQADQRGFAMPNHHGFPPHARGGQQADQQRGSEPRAVVKSRLK